MIADRCSRPISATGSRRTSDGLEGLVLDRSISTVGAEWSPQLEPASLLVVSKSAPSRLQADALGVLAASGSSAGDEHIGLLKLCKTHLHRVCGDDLDIWSALSWSTTCSMFQIDHRGERRLQGTSTHLLISWHFTHSRCRRAALLIPQPPQRTTLGLLMPTRQQAAEHLPKHRSEPRLPGTARQTNSRDGTKRRGIRRRTSTGGFAIRTSRRLARW